MMTYRFFLSLLLILVTVGGYARQESAASIWYLGHCGYAVKTKHHLLIFDYQEFRDGPQQKTRPSNPSLENGWINPEEIKNFAVRVFASHSHNDHFDPRIFEWKKSIPDIQYYFSWQAAEDSSFHYLIGPRAVLKSGGVEIATINSHHSGVPEVAWLVKVDGVIIYHNGDCQPADPVAEYEFLKKHAERIDIAFVPPILDEKLKYGVQNRQLFQKYSPRLVMPMHVTAGGQMYLDFKKAGKEKLPELPIVIPERMGQKVLYDQNRK